MIKYLKKGDNKMKKFNKIAVVLAILSMTLFLFAGCQSKDSSDSGNGGTAQRKTFDKSTMEKNYKDKLAALVKDGTINQDQSGKILTALTARFDKKSHGNGGQAGGNTAKNSGNSTGGNPPNGNGGGQGKGSFSPLSELVTQKVITQAQADTVTKSVMGNRQNGGNNQNGQGNQ